MDNFARLFSHTLRAKDQKVLKSCTFSQNDAKIPSSMSVHEDAFCDQWSFKARNQRKSKLLTNQF